MSFISRCNRGNLQSVNVAQALLLASSREGPVHTASKGSTSAVQLVSHLQDYREEAKIRSREGKQSRQRMVVAAFASLPHTVPCKAFMT